jgi:elongation factor G
MADNKVVRTVSLIGADGAGKTAVTEALFRLADPKKAAPEGSTSRLDAEAEEKKRNFSLNIHPISFDLDGRSFHFLDCPGFSSFLPEVERGLRVTDGSVLVISAQSGVHHQAERHYDLLLEAKTPAFALINRCDHERASFAKAVADIEKSLKVKPVPIQMPIAEGTGIKGLVDLIAMKAHVYEKAFAKFAVTDVPADIKGDAEKLRNQMIESAAEGDDKLIEKYLEGGTLSEEEIIRGLTLGAASQKFIPVACSAAEMGLGVRELLDLTVRLLPGPETRTITGKDNHGKEVTRQPVPAAPVCCQVFRTTVDPFQGRMNLMRVFSGHVNNETVLVNMRTRTEERVSHMYRYDGGSTSEIKEAGPGDVIALLKLKDTRTGDTLADKDHPISLADFPKPKRVSSWAIAAKQGDDKLANGLHKAIDEDASLELQRSQETGETLLWGVGQAHMEVTVERIKRKSSLDIVLTVPKPPYHETITATAKAQGKFKRQTGGRGQYGDCHLEVSPLPRGSGFEFEDAIVGGTIPRQFIPSVEKGVRGSMGAGPLGGFPVVDFKVKLFFGSYHDVDSSDMAFQIAGSMGLKKALLEAKPILIEPVMKMEIVVPEEMVGAVIGDLNSRRGKVQGMEPMPRGSLIRAVAPYAEVVKYATDLHSITQGIGYFTMEQAHYDPVPAHIAQKIIEQRRAEGKVKGVEEEA